MNPGLYAWITALVLITLSIIGFSVGDYYLGPLAFSATIIVPGWLYIHYARKKTKQTIAEQEEYLRDKKDISATAKIISIKDSKSYRVTTIALDAENGAIRCYDGNMGKTILLDNLLQCDVVSSGHVVQSQKASGIMLGTAVAGGVGAMAGSLFSTKGGDFVDGLYIRFITDDVFEPLKTIELITQAAQKGVGGAEEAAKQADEVYAFAVVGMRQREKRQAQELSV